jgi:hypothetical protein
MMKKEYNVSEAFPQRAKFIVTGLATLAGLCMMMSACVADEFRNLGFDEANTIGTGIYNVDGRQQGQSWADQLLPGWSLYQNSELLTIIPINGERPSISAWLGDAQIFDLTQGKLALRLQRALPGSPLWRLEQTGAIPPQAQYLVYRNEMLELRVEAGSQLLIPLNRQNVAGIPQYTPTPTNLVYDISAYAGQEVKLAFVGPFPPAKPLPNSALGAVSYIDSIRFVTPSPELHFARVGLELLMSWPSSALGYVLQERDLADPNAPWSTVLVAPVSDGTEQQVRMTVTDGARIFRLGLE